MMIQVVECHFEVSLCSLTKRKFDIFKVYKATNQVVEWNLKVIFSFLTIPKIVFGEEEKKMIQVVAMPFELIFSS